MTASPGPRGATLLRLAITGGSADRMRILLTAMGAAAGTLALLAAAAVVSIGPSDGPYSSDVLNERGLHQGVVIALILLCLPLLVFVGQCSRIGAPARDRRLAAFRMAGATPADAVKIAATETGLAAALGSLLGAGMYLSGRVLLDRPHLDTVTVMREARENLFVGEPVTGPVWNLPTDVIAPWWVIASVVIAIPIAAGVLSVVALRRVALTPQGVIRRQPLRPPAGLPAILFAAGAGGLAAFEAVVRTFGLGDGSLKVRAAIALSLFLLCGVGLLLGSAAMAASIGAVLAPRVSKPAILIASRRMIAAPFTASRASAAVLLAVLVGAVVQGVRENFLLITDPNENFYADTFMLVDAVLAIAIALAAASLLVTAAEGVVERRRTLAALAAAGTPRGVLARAIFAETLLPLAPTCLLAAVAGSVAVRGVLGTRVSPPGDSRTVPVPVPWAELAILTGGTLLATAVVTALALLFLRRSTNITELRTAA
ncbi:MAG: hypothetical protein M3Q17_02980 [Actinomycetota bacterium]|nr:hypothetical protein [Actinomycetota bacterium]